MRFKFMAGRNGTDSLFYFCAVLYLVLYGINLILHNPWIYYTELIILVLSIYRLLSRNIVQRQKEAAAFNRILAKFFPNSKLNSQKIVEGRKYQFVECPYCGTTMRFPRKKGKFNITCPKCQYKIKVNNRFK